MMRCHPGLSGRHNRKCSSRVALFTDSGNNKFQSRAPVCYCSVLCIIATILVCKTWIWFSVLATIGLLSTKAESEGLLLDIARGSLFATRLSFTPAYSHSKALTVCHIVWIFLDKTSLFNNAKLDTSKYPDNNIRNCFIIATFWLIRSNSEQVQGIVFICSGKWVKSEYNI